MDKKNVILSRPGAARSIREEYAPGAPGHKWSGVRRNYGRPPETRKGLMVAKPGPQRSIRDTYGKNAQGADSAPHVRYVRDTYGQSAYNQRDILELKRAVRARKDAEEEAAPARPMDLAIGAEKPAAPAPAAPALRSELEDARAEVEALRGVHDSFMGFLYDRGNKSDLEPYVREALSAAGEDVDAFFEQKPTAAQVKEAFGHLILGLELEEA